MAITTPNMKLNVWNSLTDVYDHSQLASNFIAIDAHDHGSNGGAQIDGSVAIKDASIPGSKMASDFSYSFASGSIPGSAIQSATITNQQIANNAVTYNKISSTPYCEMTTSGTSIVAGSTETIFGFNTSTYDNWATISGTSNTMADTSNKRIYAKLAGSYQYSVNFAVNAATLTMLPSNPYLAAAVYKNETSTTTSPTAVPLTRTVSTYSYAGGSQGTYFISISGLANLTVGDYLSVFYRNLLSGSSVPLISTGGTSGGVPITFKLAWIGYYS